MTNKKIYFIYKKYSIRKEFWFPYYFSSNENDFVYSNNLATCQNEFGCTIGETKSHSKIHLNIPYHLNNFQNENKNIALGCSFTYGQGIEKCNTYPSLLGYSNYGVNGIGIDSIYLNLVNLLKEKDCEKIIILFPALERRLLRFQKKEYHFRVPVGLMSDANVLLKEDYYWASQDFLQNEIQKTMKQIVDDVENEYSIEYLKKISKLSSNIFVSSYNKTTYKILPKFFKNILPKFDKIDTAHDDIHHPGPKSHQRWVKKCFNM